MTYMQMLGKISRWYLTANNYSGHNNILLEKERERQKDPFLKRILIVDDDPDITLTFKVGLDGYYYDKKRFEVYTYNNPVLVLS